MPRGVQDRRSATPELSGRAGTATDLWTYRLADGTVIGYLDQGPRDAGVTVVLVHGWSQDHTSWDDVLELLDTEHPDLRVIAYDARGHGWSDAGPRGTATVEQFGDDVADVIAGLVPTGRIVLAGHSLGGPVIMAFAERHPDVVRDRVRGVALVATSAAGLGRDVFGLPGTLTGAARLVTPFVMALRSHSHARVNLYFPGLLAAFIRRGFYGPGQASRHNRMRTARQTSRAHPATTAQLVTEMLRHDRLATLGELDSVPTVVLAGTKDGLCPIAHSRAMASAMPHTQFVVYAGAGHMLPYERPADVTDEIVALATK